MSDLTQVEYLYRHEYGKLVALLARRVGVQYLEEVEDAVQCAMAQALEGWHQQSMPKSPAAWLYRVAFNQLISELRSSKRRDALLAEHSQLETLATFQPDEVEFSGEINSSMLRMLFIACDDDIPIESQLVFTLKSLCGFSI